MEVALLDHLGDVRLAFVQSCWHKENVEQCRRSFASEIERRGLPSGRIDHFEVPGAFEIPLHAKLLAQTGRYDAIIAAGFVVDGGIYRHEFVAGAVIDALMRVQLDTEIPVISAVLTPQQFHEHAAHASFFLSHMIEKGREAASACIGTLESIARVKASSRLKEGASV